MSDFKLGDGSTVNLVNIPEGIKIVDGHSIEITTSGAFSYIRDCYDKLLSNHLKLNDNISITHLGCGLGYDLLYVDNFFKYNTKKRNIKELVGVDLTDYDKLRVEKKLFTYPIEFHNMDVMKYLNNLKVDNKSNETKIVFIDLFLKGIKPINLVYNEKFWEVIIDKINPKYIIVNVCGGEYTYNTIKEYVDFINYDKWSHSLEFYEF